MKKAFLLSTVVCLFISGVSFADIFAAGTAHEFEIDFVPISGATNPSSGYGIVNNDYRMGTYEITNSQWDKFVNSYGTVTGSEGYGFIGAAYDESAYWSGTNIPTNEVSWYEAAQFVNYLNASKGYSEAYKFTGTRGTDNYTFTVWESGDAGYNPSNPYRNSNAYYFLPTEDEWVKAAYWNGTSLQTYATVGDVAPTQNGWNYYDDGYATNPPGPWDVGSGFEELNSTYDMMGNVWEWMESPYYDGVYLPDSLRGVRSGSCDNYDLICSYRYLDTPDEEFSNRSFRVASVPEPCSLVLLGLGGVVLRYRKR